MKLSRQAIGRKTDAASALEQFLDEERDNLSPNLFDGLEEVAEEIEEIAEILEEQISDLESTVDEKDEEIRQLELQIEEMEESK